MSSQEAALCFRDTVFNAVLQHQLCAFFGRLPPGCDASSRWLSAEICKHFEGLVENSMLLFHVHGGRIFVRVTVETAVGCGISTLGTPPAK